MATKTRVIIDTDPGVDDITAILLALASPEIEILAFIITFGNTDIDHAYDNIRKLFQALTIHFEKHPDQRARFPGYTLVSEANSKGFTDQVPFLAKGEQRPLDGEMYTAKYFHGRDGLSDVSTRHPELNIQNSSAWSNFSNGPDPRLPYRPTQIHGPQLTLNLLKQHPSENITYIAMGPLTSLAKACEMDRDLVRTRIGRVLVMGGAVDVPGNTSPVAEFNWFADPFAVHNLLIAAISEATLTAEDDGSSGKREDITGLLPLEKFLMFPLDITKEHALPFDAYKKLVDPGFADAPSQEKDKSWLVHFTSSYLERVKEVMAQYNSKNAMELHDILPVWYAITHPWPPAKHQSHAPSPFAKSRLSNGWKVTARRFEIERTGSLTRGMLIVDRRSFTSSQSKGHNRAYEQTKTDLAEAPDPVGAQSASDAKKLAASTGSTAANEHPGDEGGVLCATGTPGDDVLVKLLFERIWGIDT